ncbi:MAG: hypothetical protein LBL04_01940 [Bacteroidales bacterium]|jgi:fibronectin type 3 domain-containing protein|nr:hypothetical protein [Bacteroidales bacterium]
MKTMIEQYSIKVESFKTDRIRTDAGRQTTFRNAAGILPQRGGAELMPALFVFAVLVSFCMSVRAQRNVALLCSPRPDSILLRWAPADPETWLLGNRYGYVVTRHTILRDGAPAGDIEEAVLSPQPLAPRPPEEWERHEADRYVSIAAECIFTRDSIPAAGNPHLVARRYRGEQNRFAFALYAADHSVTAARLSGLYTADRSAKKNEKYLYRVYIPVPATDTLAIPSDTAYAFTGISEYRPLPPPLDLKAHWNDRKAELSWDILYLGHIYNSYIVEKSTDGKRFLPLGDNAVVQLADEGITPQRGYKTDTLDNNTATYHYRVRGINAFGETGPPGDTVSGRGRIPLSGAPVITGSEVRNNSRVYLRWTYPETMNDYISGFRIYRSHKPEGVKDLLYGTDNPAGRDFTDEKPGLTNYYTISVFNSAGEEALSPLVTYAELIDSIPPAPPAGLTGSIDSAGRVLVRWKRNTEADMEGYRVYRANRPGFEFVSAHPAALGDTVFTDSVNIRVLDAKIFYRVRAIDLRQNQSAFSEILALDKPDVIPPASPVIKGIEAQGKTIVLTWINSPSADVARHHVFRQAAGDTAYMPLAAVEHSGDHFSAFTDNAAQPGVTYRYRVAAEDRSGLFSAPSKPVQGKTPSASKESITLKVRRTADRVTLSWTIATDRNVKRILVYRKTGDAPMQLLDNVTGDSYSDTGLHLETRYMYCIKAVYDDDTVSTFSNSESAR